MFYRFALIVVVGGFLLVPAVPTWARRVDCVDGQTPPRQAVQCDVDGEVNGVCTFLRCRPCRLCVPPIPVFFCNNKHPIVVPVGRLSHPWRITVALPLSDDQHDARAWVAARVIQRLTGSGTRSLLR